MYLLLKVLYAMVLLHEILRSDLILSFNFQCTSINDGLYSRLLWEVVVVIQLF